MENNMHIITIEDKKNLSATEIEEVICLTEEKIILKIKNSKRLVISGNNLKMGNFSKDNGKFLATGNISEIKYLGEKSTLIKKIMK